MTFYKSHFKLKQSDKHQEIAKKQVNDILVLARARLKKIPTLSPHMQRQLFMSIHFHEYANRLILRSLRLLQQLQQSMSFASSLPHAVLLPARTTLSHVRFLLFCTCLLHPPNFFTHKYRTHASLRAVPRNQSDSSEIVRNMGEAFGVEKLRSHFLQVLGSRRVGEGIM